MSETYTKLFSSITRSSVWLEDDQTLRVWVTMLALADRNGFVGASVGGLAATARVDRGKTEEALEKFLAPDPDSRSKDNDGRRIEVADRGWILLNYDRFRDMRDEEARKEYDRNRKRESRAREKEQARNAVPDASVLSQDIQACPEKSALSAQAEAEAEADHKQKADQKENENPTPPPKVGDAAKAAKPRRSKPAAIVALETALSAVMADRGETAPALSQSLAAKAAKRVTDHAALAGVALDEAARMLAVSWASSGHANAWKLCDVPFTAQGAQRASQGRPGRAQATTGADFANVASFEEQLQRIGGKK